MYFPSLTHYYAHGDSRRGRGRGKKKWEKVKREKREVKGDI